MENCQWSPVIFGCVLDQVVATYICTQIQLVLATLSWYVCSELYISFHCIYSNYMKALINADCTYASFEAVDNKFGKARELLQDGF